MEITDILGLRRHPPLGTLECLLAEADLRGRLRQGLHTRHSDVRVWSFFTVRSPGPAWDYSSLYLLDVRSIPSPPR